MAKHHAAPGERDVIRPDAHIDPGIKAPTPPATRFPTPVIKPGTTGTRPPA